MHTNNSLFGSPVDGSRYGHYCVGDIKTYSKIEMIDLLYRRPTSWSWNYHDEFFGSYDWKQEPAAAINELYRRRAEQLRRDYDYLVLYYSGGYDSANMLYAFLDNEIPIDEICVFYSRFDSMTNQYIELNNYTYDKIEKIKAAHPDLKIRHLDYADYYLTWHQHITQLGYGANLLEAFGNMLTVNRMAVDFAVQWVPDWKSLVDHGKSLAFVMGCDKPMIRYKEGQWIFNFHDGIVHARVTPIRQIVDQGDLGVMEFFYWAPEPECADIMIKQCHNLRRRYEPQARQDFAKIPGAKPYRSGWGWEIDTMHADFVATIYPRLFGHGESFYTVKNPKHIFGNRDQWFFNSNHDAARVFHDVYASTKSTTHSHRNHWFNNPDTIDDGIRNCISPDYMI